MNEQTITTKPSQNHPSAEAVLFDGLDQRMSELIRERPVAAMIGILAATYIAQAWETRGERPLHRN